MSVKLFVTYVRKDSQGAVKCSSCSEWQHCRCAKLTKMQISLLVYLNSNQFYICSVCLNDILPFQQVCDAEFREMFYNHFDMKIFKQITTSLSDEQNIDDLIKTNIKISNVIKSVYLTQKNKMICP